MSKRGEVPGNSVQSQAEFERYVLSIGQAMLSFERIADRMYEADQYLTSASTKFKTDNRSEYLVVIRLSTDTGQFVSFHSADTLAEAYRGMVARLDNGSVKWTEDQYG